MKVSLPVSPTSSCSRTTALRLMVTTAAALSSPAVAGVGTSSNSNNQHNHHHIANNHNNANFNPTTATHQHYFAIGAMMNPTSVKNRNLNLEVNHPARPGILRDHKLNFFGPQGFAEVVYEEGSCLHGVVYENVPTDQMKELDLIERDYIRKYVDIQIYPPFSNDMEDAKRDALSSATLTLKNVSVYCRSEEEIEKCRRTIMDQPPSERYLSVLILGAKHYGLDPKYIQWLQDQEYRPRCHPSEYVTFLPPEGEPGTLHDADVETLGNGENGNPFYVRCNGRVVELLKEHADDPFFHEWKQVFSQRKRDVELFISKVQYDPRFGIPAGVEDMSPEWRNYCEHLFCEYMKGNNLLHRWKVIAKLL